MDLQVENGSKGISKAITGLTMHKTLKDALPSKLVDTSSDQLHFTEDGGIYLSKTDGTFKKVGIDDENQAKIDKIKDMGVVVEHLELKELSNPLTTKPLEYGYFKLSQNQSNVTTTTTNIKFDTSSNGNIGITTDGIVKLKQGKTYEISCGIHCQTSNNGDGGVLLWDLTNNVMLTRNSITPVTNTTHMIQQPILNCIITPESDIDIALRFNITTVTTVYSENSYLIVRETRTNPVAQYGGFETQVLFDGSANVTQKYVLNGIVDDYNYLVVESLSDSTTKQVYIASLIDVTKIDTSITGQFINSAYVSNTNNYSIQYHFTDKKSFTISNISNQGYTNPLIARVVGLKGQLPSLLNGGVF